MDHSFAFIHTHPSPLLFAFAWVPLLWVGWGLPCTPSTATPEELAKEIFYCVYMASEHSGEETRTRARDLAAQIGANFDVIRYGAIVWPVGARPHVWTA